MDINENIPVSEAAETVVNCCLFATDNASQHGVKDAVTTSGNTLVVTLQRSDGRLNKGKPQAFRLTVEPIEPIRLDAPTSEIVTYVKQQHFRVRSPIEIHFDGEEAHVETFSGTVIVSRLANGKLTYRLTPGTKR